MGFFNKNLVHANIVLEMNNSNSLIKVLRFLFHAWPETIGNEIYIFSQQFKRIK
jgi:hypothetical protein